MHPEKVSIAQEANYHEIKHFGKASSSNESKTVEQNQKFLLSRNFK
jgi:hypothetical protein